MREAARHAHDDLQDLPEDPDVRRKTLLAFREIIKQAVKHWPPFLRLLPKKKSPKKAGRATGRAICAADR